jgi:hypothetical protein
MAVKSAAELVAAQYGIDDVLFEESAAGVVANIAPAVLVRNASHRLTLVLVNLSANTIYARPMGAPSTARGQSIPANGGTMILNWRDDLTLQAYEWQISAAADASAYYYQALYIGGHGKGATP